MNCQSNAHQLSNITLKIVNSYQLLIQYILIQYNVINVQHALKQREKIYGAYG